MLDARSSVPPTAERFHEKLFNGVDVRGQGSADMAQQRRWSRIEE